MSDRNLAHTILGRYQLLVAVARGGMGQVWLGRLLGARGFNKVVAIKTLLPDENDRARLEGMLAEEARIASLIQHANVVHTIELGEHEDLLYLVMEWVDGEPLGFVHARAAERGGMPVGVAVALVAQVLAGLHAAHELQDESGPLGVVHRDVSPHNILVTYDGVAKLLDFGIAKATEGPSHSHNTHTGEIKGKFSYMAPEQIMGDDVDRRCDVFATGIVLYWLTTGKHPFKQHNNAAVIHSITSETPVAPPSTLVEDFPAELERVLLRALQKDREQRWSSAEEMRLALEKAMPEAFGDSGRLALRELMERAVGDRKAARREAVRRAQLTADSSETGSAARALAAHSSQSASSLRALAISQPAPENVPQLVSATTAEGPAVIAPRSRPKRAPWLAAGAGLALAFAALLPRIWSQGQTVGGSASVAAHAEAPMLTREPPPSPVATVALPSASVTSLPPVATQDAPTPRASMSAAKPLSKSPAPPRTGKLKPGTAKVPSAQNVPNSGDLLAPDYAR